MNEQELYLLYLEGLSNELIHLIQSYRKKLKLDILADIDVAIIENPITKLTSAIYVFNEKIVNKCRIRQFKPISLDNIQFSEYTSVVDYKNNIFPFDLNINVI
jgi:hypothetical protein